MKNIFKYLKNIIVVSSIVCVVFLHNNIMVSAGNYHIIGEVPINEEFALTEYTGHYSFEVTEPGKVSIISSRDTTDPIGIYRDGSKIEVGYYLLGSGEPIRISPGKYNIGYLRGGNLNSGITYKIIFESESSLMYEQEENNSFDTANFISVNNLFTGNINYVPDSDNFDQDYYKFKTDSGGSLSIDFSRFKYSQYSQYFREITVYSENSNDYNMTELFKFKDDQLLKKSETIRIPKGVYYLKIKNESYRDNNATDYSFKVNFTPESSEAFEQENNNTAETANYIQCNTDYSGNLGSTATIEDIDYYKVELDSAGNVKMRIQIPRQVDDNMFKVELYSSNNITTPVDSILTTQNPTAYGREKLLPEGEYYIVVKKGKESVDSKIDYKINLGFKEVVQVEKIELTLSKDTYNVGDRDTIAVEVLPSNAYSKKLKWTSENKDIVKVDSFGNITCVAAGETKIIATASDGSQVVGEIELVVDEELNSDATLSSLKISTGKLNKKFTPNRRTYTLTLDKNKGKVKITPIVSDESAECTINGKEKKSITVAVGRKKSKTVNIKVIAENGDTKSYSVKVIRK